MRGCNDTLRWCSMADSEYLKKNGFNTDPFEDIRLTYRPLGGGLVGFFSNGIPIVAINGTNVDDLAKAIEDEIQNIQLRGRVNLLNVLKPMNDTEQTLSINYNAYKRVRLYAAYYSFEPYIRQIKISNVLSFPRDHVTRLVNDGKYLESFPYPSTGAPVVFLSSFLRFIPPKYHEQAVEMSRVLRRSMGDQELNRIKDEIGWRNERNFHRIEEEFDPELIKSEINNVVPNASVKLQEQYNKKYEASIMSGPKKIGKLSQLRDRNWHNNSWAMMNSTVEDLEVVNRRINAEPHEKIFNLNGQMVDRKTISNYLLFVVSSGGLLSEVANGQDGMPTMLEVYHWRKTDINFDNALLDAETVQAHVFADTALACVLDGNREDANLNRYQHDALLTRAGMQAERFREKRYSEVVDATPKTKEELLQSAVRLFKSKPEALQNIIKSVPAVEMDKVIQPEPEEEFYGDDE